MGGGIQSLAAVATGMRLQAYSRSTGFRRRAPKSCSRSATACAISANSQSRKTYFRLSCPPPWTNEVIAASPERQFRAEGNDKPPGLQITQRDHLVAESDSHALGGRIDRVVRCVEPQAA